MIVAPVGDVEAPLPGRRITPCLGCGSTAARPPMRRYCLVCRETKCSQCHRIGNTHHPMCARVRTWHCAVCGAGFVPGGPRQRACNACIAARCRRCGGYGGQHDPARHAQCATCGAPVLAHGRRHCAECLEMYCRKCQLFGGKHRAEYHPGPRPGPTPVDLYSADQVESELLAAYDEALRVARTLVGRHAAPDLVQDSVAVTWKMIPFLTSSPRAFFFGTIARRARWTQWAEHRHPMTTDMETLIALDERHWVDERGRRVLAARG
jgi:hypothetical protein